jgi:hypothetical protein
MSIEEWQAPRGGLTEFATQPQLGEWPSLRAGDTTAMNSAAPLAATADVRRTTIVERAADARPGPGLVLARIER